MNAVRGLGAGGRGRAPGRSGPHPSRRDFVRRAAVCGAAVFTLIPERVVAELSRVGSPRAGLRIVHPDPRPGIDGSGVLTRERLAPYSEEVRVLYDMVREIPHIADGIGCACGCAAMPGYRSLLTCYSEGGMAMGCAICQGEGRLAYRRHREGQTLEQIRRAIDARYG